MATVDGYLVGEALIVRVFKHLRTNPNETWSNSYELVAYTGGGIPEIEAACQRLVNFEKAMHCPAVVFDRYAVSSWVPDSKPYNPQAFLVRDLDQAVGQHGDDADLADLSLCWGVKRSVRVGRSGKLFYRGTPMLSFVNAPAGKWEWVVPGTAATEVQTAATLSGIDVLCGLEPLGGLGLCLKGKNSAGSTTLVPVTGVLCASPTVVPVNHKYYDVEE